MAVNRHTTNGTSMYHWVETSIEAMEMGAVDTFDATLWLVFGNKK